MSPSTAGLALESRLARSGMPRKIHSSVPSEPDRQYTWPSFVTTNTRSAAAVGEVRTGDSTFFSHSLLPVLASSATTVPKPVPT